MSTLVKTCLALVIVVVLVPLGAAQGAAPAANRTAADRTASTVGRPSLSYVIPATSHFSYPNRSKLERYAIRNRVLYTIRSVWGGPRNSLGTPMPGNGTIRIATWSFNDWAVAKALVAARNRGVSVQVMAAKGANRDHKPWKWLRKHLGGNLYRPGHPITREMYSFARQCPGSCRGHGGTPHSKYFLFDDVGYHHVRHVVVQTSMNLTRFAYKSQWNQAQVVRSARVYADFMRVFRQTRLGRAVPRSYHVYATGNVVDFFFPKPATTAATDPVMQILKRVRCRGATSGGTRDGRTRIRVIQYALYSDRGVWIARKLRSLWNHGCNVALIYSISSRPVLGILRNGSGRGPVPMRQSVIKNGRGEVVKYNHSKWMTVTGHWGTARGAWLTFTGSANWADLSLGSDEQMQRISSRGHARRYLATFRKTWHQRVSHVPAFGRVSVAGRMLPVAPADAPLDAPTFGRGIYRYMTED